MFRITAMLFSAAMMSSNVQADVNAEIVERIKKVGSVCIAGAECKPESGAALVAVEVEVAPSATQAVSFVEDTYNKSCAFCHNTGAAGAPKLGDTVQWSARLDKGMDVLYASLINGIGAMPAKGTCFSCSDDDLKALVDYMVESVQP